MLLRKSVSDCRRASNHELQSTYNWSKTFVGPTLSHQSLSITFQEKRLNEVVLWAFSPENEQSIELNHRIPTNALFRSRSTWPTFVESLHLLKLSYQINVPECLQSGIEKRRERNEPNCQRLKSFFVFLEIFLDRLAANRSTWARKRQTSQWHCRSIREVWPIFSSKFREFWLPHW